MQWRKDSLSYKWCWENWIVTCKRIKLKHLFLHYILKKNGLRGFSDGSVGKESACNAGDPSLILGSGRSAGEGIDYPLQYAWASLVAQLIKNPPAMLETWVWSLGWKDPWRRERLPTPVFCPGEVHGLQSMGSERVRHDWVTFFSLSSFHFYPPTGGRLFHHGIWWNSPSWSLWDQP